MNTSPHAKNLDEQHQTLITPDANQNDSAPDCAPSAADVADEYTHKSVSDANDRANTTAEAAEDSGTAAREDTAEDTAEDATDIDIDTEDSEDSLTFSNGVIEKIVALAMRDVPDVVGMKGSWFNRVQDVLGASDSRKGVTVEVGNDASVRVNISVLIKYGAYAPQVFEDVKRVVVHQVMGMTGLVVSAVNLRIEDVLTPEEYAAQDMTALSLTDDGEHATTDSETN